MPQEPKSKEPSIEDLEKQAGMAQVAPTTGAAEPDIGTLESQAADASERGFLPHLGSGLKNLAMGVLQTPQVLSNGPAGFLPVGANMAIHDMMRATDKTPTPSFHGIPVMDRSGIPYRALAGVGEGLGVNVPGMEEAADKGDVGGVMGEASAVPLAMAATGGAARLGKIPVVGQIARTGFDLGADLAKNTWGLKTLSKAGDFWRANAPTQPVTDIPAYSSDQPTSGPYRPRPAAGVPSPVAPIPPRSGLMLPGEVTRNTAFDNVADIRARLAGNPEDPFSGLDKLRAQLTTPEAEAARYSTSDALRGIPAPKGPGATPEVAQSYSLGRIKPATPRPVESPSIETETKQAIKEGRAAKIPTRVKGGAETSSRGEVAKPPETPQKPVTEPSKTERQTGYMFGEHAHEVDIGSGTHNEIRAKTYPELAEYANKRALRGKTDWKVEDFERTVAKHGKSSNSNATFVRGEMAKEANARPQALAKPKEEKPFDPFDDMAAYQPGRSVHDVMGLQGGVPKPKK